MKYIGLIIKWILLLIMVAAKYIILTLYYTIGFPFFVFSYFNDTVIAQLKYDYNYKKNYDNTYKKSRSKGMFVFLLILTAPVWVPFLFGILKEHSAVMGFGYLVFFMTLGGTVLVPICGILGIFTRDATIDYNMKKNGYNMKKEHKNQVHKESFYATNMILMDTVIRKVFKEK